MINVKEKLQKSDILKLFTCGCKTEENIGIELERIPVYSNTYKNVGYSDKICEFLREFAKTENWDYITDDYNIIGLKQGHDTITLEPGCQIELSLKPETTIQKLENKVKILDKQMKPILNKMGITLLLYGISPLTTNKYIDLIPKNRYKIMAKYLWGILSDVMMRETAGIQGCFDFKNEQDAIQKFRIANKLSPFVTAIFANSPIRGGVDTGYKTFRGLSWLNTDIDRCGFAINTDQSFSFEQYIDNVLKTPIIYLKRDDKNISVNGKINFEQFMNNGFEGYDATIEDFQLHANLYFPDVRLRNFIEIRNQDCCHFPYAILALYKGILYNKSALEEIENLLGKYKHSDITELRYNVPKNALQTKIKGHFVYEIANEIINIAEQSLKSTNEDKYLEPIKELVKNRMSPADIIIRNWDGMWNKSINKFMKYLNSLE